jgi:molybdopterin-guanine dinucleotide biosynthesis protein A
MGRDKAALEVGGVASATRIARLLDTLCDEVLLVGGDAPLAAPGSRIRDPDGPRCALRGLVAALSAAHGARVLVVATDLPLVTPTLLRGLTEGGVADAVVPRPEALAQPLCAVYARDAALARARAQLAAGRLALRGVLEGLVVDWIEGDRLRSLDPDGTALLNVNTPEDHARAETILQARSDVRVVPGAL